MKFKSETHDNFTGSRVEKYFKSYLIENFMAISMLFTEFENLAPFSRYLQSKMAKMTILEAKIDLKMALFGL